MSWLVIADDLSGAADCAIGFAAAGASTVVTLDAGGDLHETRADVIATDVDSRRLAPADAARRNLDAWQRFGAGRRLYKKIDSTLRGNWAAETAALQPAAGMAIVAPAFPATGRTTRDGKVLVQGRPLDQTDIWRLEGLAGEADLVALLSAQGLRVALAGLDLVRAGVPALREHLVALTASHTQAVVCDAETEADLATLAQASAGLPAPAFWVGSGGLARGLATALPVPSTIAAEDTALRAAGPVLALVGSLSGVCARQVACLTEHSGIESLVIPPQALRGGPGAASWQAWQRETGARLGAGQDVLLCIGRDEHFDIAEGPQLSAALAALVLPHFGLVGGLIATGGETARAMLDTAGIRALALRREIEPGVPLSDTVQTPVRRVVTKAGAFGTDAALWLAWQALRHGT